MRYGRKRKANHPSTKDASNLTTMSRFDRTSGEVKAAYYVHNGANQIACLEAGIPNGMCDGSDLVYMYDAYGNLTGDSTNTYLYNAANRLISVSDGQTTTTYQYSCWFDAARNPDGRYDFSDPAVQTALGWW